MNNLKKYALSYFLFLFGIIPFTFFGQTTLHITVSKTDAHCNGSANGSATATATGGSGGFTYNWLPTGGTSAVASNLPVGTYTVVAKDSQGDTIRDIITINQPAPLTASIDSIVVQPCFKIVGGGGACGCGNSLWAVVHGGTAPYKYSWTPNGQTTDSIFHVCYVYFTVTVTDTNGCQASAALNVVLPPPAGDTSTVVDTTSAGIANYDNFSTIKLFPVPATNQLTVSLNKAAIQTRVEIYDLQGKKVMEQKINDGAILISLDISTLMEGNYLFRIIGTNEQKTIRFSKSDK
jgi:hypothetical protein